MSSSGGWTWQPDAMADHTDGLEALTRFARIASGADIAIAFEATEGGMALPLAAAPEPPPAPFSLGDCRLDATDWRLGAIPADGVRLPAAVLAALGRPAREVHFIPTPIAEAPRSGILLLWAAQTARRCVCPFRSDVEQGIPILTSVFSQMLSDRRQAMLRRVMSDRFDDLIGSVPAGVLVIPGDGGPALVNPPASALLGLAPGENDAATLAQAMRRLRESCVNADALQTTYAAVVADVGFAVKAVWDLGDRQFEVDSHPVQGDGRNGRIWVFDEITAQHRLEQELRRLAATDPLTGLSNRRQFAESGGAMLRQTRADALPLAVLMLDIDHFKSINDRFGHPVGDVVLQATAQRCRAELRQQDLMARMGGEEFAVMLPGVGADEAAATAERLRAAIAAAPVSADELRIEVRVSIGGTGRLAEDRTLDELLGRADQALYTAKRTGRNKVVFE